MGLAAAFTNAIDDLLGIDLAISAFSKRLMLDAHMFSEDHVENQRDQPFDLLS